MKNKKIHKHASIIGFAGLAGSGKDTAGLALVTNYPNKFVHCAFANKLKEIAAVLFDIDRKILDTIEGKQSIINKKFFEDMTYRRFLQLMGSDAIRRHIDKDFWIKLLMLNIEKNNSGRISVITDVRFPNEVEYIKKAGGIVYRIMRSGHTVNESVASHESERAINDIQLPILHNDKSKEEFEEHICFLFGLTANIYKNKMNHE